MLVGSAIFEWYKWNSEYCEASTFVATIDIYPVYASQSGKLGLTCLTKSICPEDQLNEPVNSDP